jgi:hypothetical protein
VSCVATLSAFPVAFGSIVKRFSTPLFAANPNVLVKPTREPSGAQKG